MDIPTPETPIQKQLGYIGDFSREDMNSPAKARKLLALAKKNHSKHQKEIKYLQKQARTFQKRIIALDRKLMAAKSKSFVSDNANNSLKILPDIPESTSISETSVEVLRQESSSKLTDLPDSETSCGVRIEQEPGEDSCLRNEHSSPSLRLSHQSSSASPIHQPNTEPPSSTKIKRELDPDSCLSSEYSLPTIKHSFSLNPTKIPETAVCSMLDIPESTSIAETRVEVLRQESSSRLTDLPNSETSCGVRIKQEPGEDSYSRNEHSSPSLRRSYQSSSASSIHQPNTEPPSCKKIKQELDPDSCLPNEYSLPTIKHSFSVTPNTAVCSTSTEEKNNSEIRIELLGKHWVEKMKALRPNQRVYAEKLVHDVLFEAEFSRLRYGCHVENSR